MSVREGRRCVGPFLFLHLDLRKERKRDVLERKDLEIILWSRALLSQRGKEGY